ncbi:Pectate lyase catalytic [Lasiodiplodia theobromae]|uniref:Pectate lyase n=1 Tax=Lasiodiplodia theobromae TaxID=45133 RepID=A0A5N5DUC6_9PEZI|nr:Pectate lyase [Lasiodiplodia theobromae]KAB2581357.1 putative pectate lyase E [Lasiodiplodia theobromae]KAF4536063.1 Pectate lyase [Lasiodiplodia theobromae]KAF9629580.1 Pectate lyase catalytic [Lasiodiplodia theobromae]
MQSKIVLGLSLLAATGMAAPSNSIHKRADFPIPSSKGSVSYDEAKSISGTFDGGLKTYDRGVSCTGQKEGGNKDAVFLLEDGATLKNVIIGKNQIEGIHCLGSCNLENVWWEAVCEDALTFKGDGDATVTGGGATGADDKVLQHNGKGSITVDGFTVVDFGKLYRSCGNCKQNGDARKITLTNVKAYSGKSLVGINSNYGDVATITDTCATSVKDICVEYEGTNDNDKEPEKISSGPSDACVYSDLPSC